MNLTKSMRLTELFFGSPNKNNEQRTQPSFNNCQDSVEVNETIACSASGKVQECPCMHGKPFIHVMAPGFQEHGSGASKTAWKKRYA